MIQPDPSRSAACDASPRGAADASPPGAGDASRTAVAGGRRRREIVTLSDGTQRKIAKPPRADVLWYPRYSWPSILVRRTHNLELATDMAHHRWAQIGDDRPLTGTRIGWWTTYAGHTVPDDAAQDQHGRVVRWCTDTAPGASPGIEFRP